MGPVGCPETSVSDCHSTVREIPPPPRPSDLTETAARDGSHRNVSIIRRCKDHRKFAACMAVWFIIFISYSSGSILYHCTYGCVFCVLQFSFVNCVFLLLCHVLLLSCLCILIVNYSYVMYLIVMFVCSYCYVLYYYCHVCVFLLLCSCIHIDMLIYVLMYSCYLCDVMLYLL